MARRQPSHVHWRAPTTMVVAFVAGVLFTVGHHVFYHNLDGQPVDQTRYDQQMNIRIGTAFSYLVRASLVIAVGVAYWQVFWRALRGERLPVSAIDSLAGLLGSLMDFFDFTAFKASPALFVIAVISWLVPFAVIVPPATLTVTSQLSTTSSMQHVAAPNFVNAPMGLVTYIPADGGPNAGNYGAYGAPNYGGASQVLSRLVMATALQGEIPNLPSPAARSSYRLEFDGPRVQCRNISTSLLSGFNKAMACQFPGGDDCEDEYKYLAWTPATSAIIPFGPNSMSFSGLPIDPTLTAQNYSYLGAFGSGPASLFLAIDTSDGYGDWMVVNCSLWNSTYTVDFDFSTEQQTVNVVNTHDMHPVGVQWFSDWPYNTEVLADVVGPGLSYQAMMECLGKLLVGSLYNLEYLPYDTGTFLQTDIAYTREMFKMYNDTIAISLLYNNLTLQDALSSPSFGKSVLDVVEEMFENMTLTLFSKKAFVTERAIQTNVTVQIEQNIYQYSAMHLLLAYGLGVGLAFLVVLLGLVTIWRTGSSYSNKFSTVMRTTAGSSLSVLVYNMDRTGADPLEEELARLEIQPGEGSAGRTSTEGTGVGGDVGDSTQVMSERLSMLGKGIRHGRG